MGSRGTRPAAVQVISPIRRSGPYGHGDDGLPEHDGRSWCAYGRGSRAPCCADASWAGKYGTWSTLLTISSNGLSRRVLKTAFTVYINDKILSSTDFAVRGVWIVKETGIHEVKGRKTGRPDRSPCKRAPGSAWCSRVLTASYSAGAERAAMSMSVICVTDAWPSRSS